MPGGGGPAGAGAGGGGGRGKNKKKSQGAGGPKKGGAPLRRSASHAQLSADLKASIASWLRKRGKAVRPELTKEEREEIKVRAGAAPPWTPLPPAPLRPPAPPWPPSQARPLGHPGPPPCGGGGRGGERMGAGIGLGPGPGGSHEKGRVWVATLLLRRKEEEAERGQGGGVAPPRGGLAQGGKKKGKGTMFWGAGSPPGGWTGTLNPLAPTKGSMTFPHLHVRLRLHLAPCAAGAAGAGGGGAGPGGGKAPSRARRRRRPPWTRCWTPRLRWPPRHPRRAEGGEADGRRRDRRSASR